MPKLRFVVTCFAAVLLILAVALAQQPQRLPSTLPGASTSTKQITPPNGPASTPAQPGQLPPKDPGAAPQAPQAQAPEGQPAQIQDDSQGDDAKFAISTINILVPVTVRDRDGKFVSGLSPLDFALFDNGKRQQITEDVATHPISLVVAVQANSGMEQILPNVRKIGSLLNDLVLGESGEIAVMQFDHRIQTLTNFTSNPDEIGEALKKLKQGSATSKLNDAAMQAVNMLRNRPANRKRVLLLVSEARDYGSEINVREVLTAMEFANVVVFSVDVSHLMTSLTGKTEPNRPNPVPPEARFYPGGNIGTINMDSQTAQLGTYVPLFKEIFAQVKGIFIKNPLEVFTRYTGGREYGFMTQKGLEQAVADIGQELHSQYLLTYRPNNMLEGGFHDISVTVLKPDLKVTARDGYWLAAKPPGQ
jgi:VWFA-related protein